MKRTRADGPGLRRRALALADEIRNLLGRLDLVRRQLAISLYRTRGRCGKLSCHCAEGPGHPRLALGYWDGRAQHTRSLSPQQARALGPRVEAYRRFRQERASLGRLATQILRLVDRMQKLLVDRYRLPQAR